MHPILAKIDDIDAAIAGSPELTPEKGQICRRELGLLKRRLSFDLTPPAPGSTTTYGGATITHRPDVACDERARQAAQQGDADRGGYLPAQREPLAK